MKCKINLLKSSHLEEIDLTAIPRIGEFIHLRGQRYVVTSVEHVIDGENPAEIVIVYKS